MFISDTAFVVQAKISFNKNYSLHIQVTDIQKRRNNKFTCSQFRTFQLFSLLDKMCAIVTSFYITKMTATYAITVQQKTTTSLVNQQLQF